MGFLWALGFMIVGYAIQALTTKPQAVEDAKPATFSDFQFPQHQEGTPQAVVFGDCWVSDWMVLHTGNFLVQPIRKQASGKK